MQFSNRHMLFFIVFFTCAITSTAQTVEFVAQIRPTGESIVYDNKLFMAADSGSISGGLWSTDGTTAGTVLVKNINPGGDSFAADFTILNNNLYFSADNGIQWQ
ncbi:MAG: hypothetical protein IPN22_10745 [Bacteroidetes bacterium]|nr:hypothetical protein [Bacteroidota bacterium]